MVSVGGREDGSLQKAGSERGPFRQEMWTRWARERLLEGAAEKGDFHFAKQYKGIYWGRQYGASSKNQTENYVGPSNPTSGHVPEGIESGDSNSVYSRVHSTDSAQIRKEIAHIFLLENGFTSEGALSG